MKQSVWWLRDTRYRFMTLPKVFNDFGLLPSLNYELVARFNIASSRCVEFLTKDKK